MSENALTFKLYGHDVSASKALKSVGDQAGKTGREVTNHVSRMGSVGTAVASGIGAAFGGAALMGVGMLGSALVQGVKDASSYATLQEKTAAVLKSTGNAAGTTVSHIDSLAGSLESLSGVDETLIINGQNVLATFTAVQNKAGAGNDIFDQATKTALNMSVALGSDLQGANIQLGKALNDPIKGIGALSKVGVSFTEQQKDQIKALVKSGDTLGAQKVILAELNKEFGGAAEAAGKGFAGSLARAQDALGDTFRAIGTLLLPVVIKLADGLTVVVGWVSDFVNSLSSAESPLAGMSDSVGGLTKSLGDSKSVLGSTAAVIRDVAGKSFTFLSQTVQSVVKWFRSDLMPALKGFAEEVMPKVRDMLKSVTKTMSEHQDIVRAVQLVFRGLGLVLTGVVIPILTKVVGFLVSALGPAFNAVAWQISNVTIPAARLMAKVFLEVLGATLDAAANAFGWIPGIGPKLTAAAKGFHKFKDDVNAALNGIQDQTVTVFVRTAGQVDLLKQTAQYSNNSKLQVLEKRATGGPVRAGSPYLVGEEGYELFVPDQSGFIMSNNNLTGGGSGRSALMSGGSPVVVNVNGFVGNETQLAREIKRVLGTATVRGV